MTPGGARGIFGMPATDYTGRTIPARRTPCEPDATTEAVT